MSLFAGCAHVPPAPPRVQVVCPRIPDLEMVGEDVLGQNYLQAMQKFLSGSLPAPTDYGLSSGPAKTATGLHRKP